MSEAEDEYEVELIVDKRVDKGKVEYLIKWMDWDHDENTWLPEENLDCQVSICCYKKRTNHKTLLPLPLTSLSLIFRSW